MIEKIMIAIIAGVFCSMFTAIISLLMAPKLLKGMVTDAIKQHTDVWHQDSMYQYFEKEIDKHKDNCPANQDIEMIRIAVIWLVEKQGGDIMKLVPKKGG